MVRGRKPAFFVCKTSPQLCAYLSVVGTIAVYMARWPEFSADGSGNYTLDRSKIPPNDPFASSQ